MNSYIMEKEIIENLKFEDNSLSPKSIVLKYVNYFSCHKFLSVVWKAKVLAADDNTIIRLSAIEPFKLDDFILWLIHSILNCTINKIENGYDLVIPTRDIQIPKSELLSFLSINLLNNNDKKDLFKSQANTDDIGIEIVDDKPLIALINCVLNMVARDYMEAYWRVGDKGDIEDYYKEVKFVFPSKPNYRYVALLKSVITKINPTDNPCIYEYKYHRHEIARGYGRSYDYDNSDTYKSGIVPKLTILFFDSFKQGYGIE